MCTGDVVVVVFVKSDFPQNHGLFLSDSPLNEHWHVE